MVTDDRTRVAESIFTLTAALSSLLQATLLKVRPDLDLDLDLEAMARGAFDAARFYRTEAERQGLAAGQVERLTFVAELVPAGGGQVLRGNEHPTSDQALAEIVATVGAAAPGAYAEGRIVLTGRIAVPLPAPAAPPEGGP